MNESIAKGTIVLFKQVARITRKTGQSYTRRSTAKANSSVKRGQIGRPGDGVDPSGGWQPVRSGGPAATDPRLGRTLPPDLSPLTEMHPRVK